MSELRIRMMRDLELGSYAEGTRRAYINSIADLARFHGRCPSELSQDDLRCWVEHLSGLRIGWQRLGQHFAALRFLYNKTLGTPQKASFLTRRSGQARLPTVLSVEEIKRLLSATHSEQLHES